MKINKKIEFLNYVIYSQFVLEIAPINLFVADIFSICIFSLRSASFSFFLLLRNPSENQVHNLNLISQVFYSFLDQALIFPLDQLMLQAK